MKRLGIALIITALVFLAELIGGLVSNSLALLSDAGHMLTDTMALGLALAAMYFSTRPATSKRTFGFYRLEILSALFNGSFLFLVALFIFFEAYQRFLYPAEIKSGIMLAVAGAGLIANLAGVLILARGSHDNLNIRGAFLHVVSDAISSCGVIIGGIIIYYTGWTMVDPILGIMIAILILRGAVMLVFESVNILLESTPKGIELEAVVADIKKVNGVKGLHDVHIWTITSGLNAISAHLLIDDALAGKSSEILGNIRRCLEDKYNIKHCTFQTECQSCPEGIICKVGPSKPEERHAH